MSGPGSLLSFVRANELFGDFPEVSLEADGSSIRVPLASEESADPSGPSPETAEKEEALYVEIEQQAVRLKENKLTLSIRFSRPLAEEMEASIFLFGYRSDKPFSDMPKLRVRLTRFGYAVYDQVRKRPLNEAAVTRTPKEVAIEVPLERLGYPDRILTGARMYAGEIPWDWAVWRVLRIAAERTSVPER